MDFINEYIEKNYSAERKKHTYAVYDTAVELSGIYGADAEKAGTAALFHDLFRGVPQQTLNYYVRHLNMEDKYYDKANLAHGKIAALLMRRDFGVDDEDVLNAVNFHTTGRAGMSLLEKVVFLADAIEPGRDYPGVEEVRAAAYRNLDDACLLCMEKTIEYITARGFFVDDETIQAMDYLKKERMNEE